MDDGGQCEYGITMLACCVSSPGPTKLSAGFCNPVSIGLEAVTLTDTATDQPETLIRTEPAAPYMRASDVHYASVSVY